MTKFIHTHSRKARCLAAADVSDAALLTVADISEDARPESGRLCCELGAGHDDGHVALLATAHGGEQWWWLRWDRQPGADIEVIQIDPCTADLPQGPYAEDCFLPGAHAGPHSFNMRPPPPLPGKRHPFRRRHHTVRR